MKNYHTKLFPYAYNILGSSEDAKDVIQDVLMNYSLINNREIENETGYLIKSVINQSINLKKRRSKISANSLWLPEPYSTESADDNLNKEDILTYSMLVLLENLTAKERAVFILKEAFNYSHKEIAETVNFSIENCRKLLSRAKSKLSEHKTANSIPHPQHTSFLENYIEIIKKGDMDSLEKLLAEDILLAADGGENIKVVRELTTGTRNVSKLILYVYKAFLNGLSFKVKIINHQPAILFYKEDVLYNCQVFELDGMKIKSIYSVVDPKKLASPFL
ncbi:sigma-70 family RNA polymerase sigma factor [Abyssalbus ytuae]|uniref:Sigma-70 family RNA polymerase sigma factor n=1 Tax=Abyssalbus ytuae TaxID=2926907 RepID=A0A9E6ZM54_9FLAO|nr:sigma-70 family RNA polymerase sigma factor [Abyssalbus ytuae]UOB16820.1 sigma-70 family RNA polymerase sigma factor [Abyssalbus ytuae]